MSFKQFTQDAIRTESKVEKAQVNMALFVHAVNLSLAATRIMDQIKKNIYYGKEVEGSEMANAIRSAHNSASLLLYSEQPMNDENIGEVPNVDPRVLHGVIGKFTESGELLEAVVKAINTGEFDVVNIGEELGDDQWYNAILVDALGLDMTTVQETVINKLKARYPEKFTSEGAINRDLKAERDVLEVGLTGTGDQ